VQILRFTNGNISCYDGGINKYFVTAHFKNLPTAGNGIMMVMLI